MANRKRTQKISRRVGRPTKYAPSLCQAVLDYFDQPAYVIGAFGAFKANPPKLLSGFAREIGVDTDTLVEWGKVHPEFSVAIKKAKEMQEAHLVACGFVGASNPAVTIFLLKNNHGYKDRLDVNGNGVKGGDTYHITSIRIDGAREELARDLVAGLSRRTARPAEHD